MSDEQWPEERAVSGVRGDVNDQRPIQAMHAVARAYSVDSRRADWRAGQIMEDEGLDSRSLAPVYLQVVREIVEGRPMPDGR